MSTGKFFVFEGIDGSGTTSVSKAVVDKLNSMSINAVWMNEPSSGKIGKLIREILSEGSPDIHTLALLFAADRIDHYRNYILPSLISGNVVVCDRYRLSALAYQSPKAGLNWVQHIDAVPDPIVTILLDVDAEEGFKRVLSRSRTLDYFERLDKMRDIRDSYLDIINNGTSNYEGDVYVVDASEPFEEVFIKSFDILTNHL